MLLKVNCLHLTHLRSQKMSSVSLATRYRKKKSLPNINTLLQAVLL